MTEAEFNQVMADIGEEPIDMGIEPEDWITE